MKTRMLGRDGLAVSAIGYGCMRLSFGYGPALAPAQGIAMIRAALDRGVTFFDTAKAYAQGAKEALLGAATGSARQWWWRNSAFRRAM